MLTPVLVSVESTGGMVDDGACCWIFLQSSHGRRCHWFLDTSFSLPKKTKNIVPYSESYRYKHVILSAMPRLLYYGG
jgi:hypothetical protein